MKILILPLVLSGLLLAQPALAEDTARLDDGWLAKASRAASEGQPAAEPVDDPFQRGSRFGERDAAELAEAWRIHDTMTRRSTGLALDLFVAKTADQARKRLSPETLQEMGGIADGLTRAGIPITIDQVIGWNAFMDLSLYWSPLVAADFPGAVNGTYTGVGGTLYGIQTAERPRSLTTPDQRTLRFEVSAGDVWQYDSPTLERSEISGPVYPAGETLTVSYDFMVEPGAPNRAKWLVLGQVHANDTETPPPFSIELVGEKMAVKSRHMLADGRTAGARLYLDDADLERGRYYRIKVRASFPEEGDGFVQVWRDGKQIVDYAGPVGYGYGVYWKQGIYRPNTPDTLAVNYRGSFVTSGRGMIVLRQEDRDAAEIQPDG